MQKRQYLTDRQLNTVDTMRIDKNTDKGTEYPGQADFIFTIFDDTDVATYDYIKPIYDRIAELGFRTTKTVWPLPYSGESDYTGSHSLENSAYLEYIQHLQKIGFEIAFHGATMETSTRENTQYALDKFHRCFGDYPKSYAAHSNNRDNIYWGRDRFSIILFKLLYQYLSKTPANFFQGHIENSEFFWGDLAKKHIKYTRNFTYDGINLLKKNCPLPYRDPNKPWSNYWFYTCDADNVESFNVLLSEKNQEKLIRERGVCIISTHLGKGFTVGGKLHTQTDILLKKLSKENGWFAPVSHVLDYLSAAQVTSHISPTQLFMLELEWFISAVIRRKKNLPYQQTEIPYLTPDPYHHTKK